MTETVIMTDVARIIRRTLNDETLQLTDASNAREIDAWDSIAHLQIIAELEKAFKLRFALGELQKLKNVGDLVALIARKSS